MMSMQLAPRSRESQAHAGSAFCALSDAVAMAGIVLLLLMAWLEHTVLRQGIRL